MQIKWEDSNCDKIGSQTGRFADEHMSPQKVAVGSHD